MTDSGSLGDELFSLVRSLQLPVGDYAIFGSGPLIVRGIIKATNDLDIISRGAAWEQVRQIGEVSSFDDSNECVNLFDQRITFGITWKYGSFDINELIETADLIDGLPFVRLEHVIAYKQAADRPKDREHLRRLRRSRRACDRGTAPDHSR